MATAGGATAMEPPRASTVCAAQPGAWTSGRLGWGGGEAGENLLIAASCARQPAPVLKLIAAVPVLKLVAAVPVLNLVIAAPVLKLVAVAPILEPAAFAAARELPTTPILKLVAAVPVLKPIAAAPFLKNFAAVPVLKLVAVARELPATPILEPSLSLAAFLELSAWPSACPAGEGCAEEELVGRRWSTRSWGMGRAKRKRRGQPNASRRCCFSETRLNPAAKQKRASA